MNTLASSSLRTCRDAFSLIELLIVMSILGIISAIGLISYSASLH